ncbi:MAG TPA: cytidylate kinase-like family protein [Firmicutes bacterium]|nr:cytidylate kinase-like family protein [Bacillota bacterium]
MKSLAIEREFGSGGREIGMKVARMAGIPYYDSALMVKAAEAQGISVGMLEEYDEKRSGSFLYDIAAYTSYANGNRKNSVYELFSGMEKTIRKLELEGPAVFIGRCSTEILKERSNVLRVYIYSSDISRRIERTVKTEGVSETEAKRLLDKKDKQRRNYFRFWTQKEWGDRANYDMELNTSFLSAEECARILLSAMG